MSFRHQILIQPKAAAEAAPWARKRSKNAHGIVCTKGVVEPWSPLAHHHRLYSSSGGGARAGRVAAAIVDALVVLIAVGSILPMAALLVVAEGHKDMVAVAGLLLAWAALELRTVRWSTRSTP